MNLYRFGRLTVLLLGSALLVGLAAVSQQAPPT